MTTRNSHHDDHRFDASQLDRALETVSIRLRDNRGKPQEIVVCGGSALILTGAVARTTQDVDILALDPTPDEMVAAAQWAMTHDVSEGFASILKDMLRSIGNAESADRL